MNRSLISIIVAWTTVLLLAGYPFKIQAEEAFDLNTVTNAFIFNFAKFTTWPENVFVSNDAPLNICLYGTSIDFNNIALNLEKKTIESHSIKVIVLSNDNNLKNCHVLYVDKSSINKISYKTTKHTLTISDSDNFYADGGMISLLVVSDRMYFKANPEQIQESELIMNGQLLRLALNLRKQDAN